MQKELIDWIVLEFMEYKRYVVLLRQYEFAGIKALQLSEVPRSITNKFHSTTEDYAIDDKEKGEIIKRIERVESWLNYLNYVERYIVEASYIERYKPHKIIKEWETRGETYYSENHWYYIKKQALKKIGRLYI